MGRVKYKKVKPKKKPKKKTLMKKADSLFSQVILSGGNCEVSGEPAINAHHYIGRKNMRLRYDLRNGVRLNFQKHTGGKVSAHNDPDWFVSWFKEYRLEDYEYIRVAKHEIVTTTVEWYQDNIKRLEKILEKVDYER